MEDCYVIIHPYMILFVFHLSFLFYENKRFISMISPTKMKRKKIEYFMKLFKWKTLYVDFSMFYPTLKENNIYFDDISLVIKDQDFADLLREDSSMGNLVLRKLNSSNSSNSISKSRKYKRFQVSENLVFVYYSTVKQNLDIILTDIFNGLEEKDDFFLYLEQGFIRGLEEWNLAPVYLFLSEYDDLVVQIYDAKTRTTLNAVFPSGPIDEYFVDIKEPKPRYWVSSFHYNQKGLVEKFFSNRTEILYNGEFIGSSTRPYASQKQYQYVVNVSNDLFGGDNLGDFKHLLKQFQDIKSERIKFRSRLEFIPVEELEEMFWIVERNAV